MEDCSIAIPLDSVGHLGHACVVLVPEAVVNLPFVVDTQRRFRQFEEVLVHRG